MKTHSYAIIHDPIPATLPNPVLVTFDERDKVIMVAIDDPILYNDVAKAFMLKRDIELVPREAVSTADLEALKAFCSS